MVLAICFVFMGVGSVSAQPPQKHTFELAPEISYIVYKEPGLMKEEGMMYGLAGSYAYRFSFRDILRCETSRQSLMLKAEGRGSFGKVDYENSGKIDNIRDYMLEARGLFGVDFPLSNGVTFSPYAGIGYRYLNDDIGGKTYTIGARGYERESNYIYSPLGMSFIIDLARKWSIGQTIEYDLFWWGKQKSRLSDVHPALNNVSNRQREGYGLRGSLTLLRKGEHVDIEVGPFIRYWHIQRSDVETLTYHAIPIGNAWEPKNKSTEIGITGGIKF